MMNNQMSEEETNREIEKAEREYFMEYSKVKYSMNEIDMDNHEVEIIFDILVCNGFVGKISITWKRELYYDNTTRWSIKKAKCIIDYTGDIGRIVESLNDTDFGYGFSFYSNTFSTHMLSKFSKERIKDAIEACNRV